MRNYVLSLVIVVCAVVVLAVIAVRTAGHQPVDPANEVPASVTTPELAYGYSVEYIRAYGQGYAVGRNSSGHPCDAMEQQVKNYIMTAGPPLDNESGWVAGCRDGLARKPPMVFQ